MAPIPDPIIVRRIAVKVGDHVRAGQLLLELETNKATMEVPAPFGGVVRAINCTEGEELPRGVEPLDIEPE